MKILRESAVGNYLNTAKVGKNSNKSVQLHETGKNFDQLMIDSRSRQNAETQIAKAAKKEALRSVYQNHTPEEKIADLKQQVAQGMYKVDPDAVAAKILWLGGKA